ncbi:hypothetical protein HQ308_20025 [Rhodococcus sp. BP-241]|uniref:hypothetical protein n=1 Tax=Rhodococcus sp. BP-241 TaxID=2739441 RepID=UPI001C9ACE71|nr:hypothetical protein [Rhodococcus sp. BP-241]MBY6709081.1 hypothetical protein [Rhodococcus sp. BP-241]
MSVTSVTPVDPSAVRAAAQAALNDRLAHIDTIVTAQNDRAAAADEVRAAQAREAALAAAETAAFRAAVAGGWTVTELRKAGLSVPDSVARPSKRAARTTGGRGRGADTASGRPRDTTAPAVETTDDAARTAVDESSAA